MSAVVHVRDLCVELPDGSVIAEDAEIRVEAGEVVSILGPAETSRAP